jgi:hypothetical protein
MKILRTPETRLTDLPDFALEPRCHQVTRELRRAAEFPERIARILCSNGSSGLAIEARGSQAGAEL